MWRVSIPVRTPNLLWLTLYHSIDAGCNSDGRVYDITPGEPVPVCGTAKTVQTFDYTEDVQNETEDYNIVIPKFTSHGYKNCVYTGTADHVGTFECDGFPSAVSCITPAAQATSCSDSHSLDEDDFTPIIYCEWYSGTPSKRNIPETEERNVYNLGMMKHVEW